MIHIQTNIINLLIPYNKRFEIKFHVLAFSIKLHSMVSHAIKQRLQSLHIGVVVGTVNHAMKLIGEDHSQLIFRRSRHITNSLICLVCGHHKQQQTRKMT